MRKLLWHTVLICPAFLASYWLTSSSTMSAASNAYALGVPTKGAATQAQENPADSLTSIGLDATSTQTPGIDEISRSEQASSQSVGRDNMRIGEEDTEIGGLQDTENSSKYSLRQRVRSSAFAVSEVTPKEQGVTWRRVTALLAMPEGNLGSTTGVNPINGLSATPVATPQIDQGIPDAVVQEQTTLDSEEPVTSVSQLTDVRPTDWAFQALQSLIERYGCIAGNPDGTYRGNRALTRYEFAAGLNACLRRVNELIAASTTDFVRKEDLAAMQKLQEQFAGELATLRDRADTLEARTAKLEAHQFSTTTRLAGQVIFAVNAGGFSGKRIVDPIGTEITRQQPNATVLYRAALDLNTSFSGKDLLKLRLDTVSGIGKDNTAGFLEPNFGSVLEYTIRGTPNGRLGVSRLYYTFNPVNNVTISLGPSLVTTDYIDLNSYASGIIDFSTYSLVNNLLLFPVNGPSAGAVVNWNPGQGPFKLRALYAAGDAANSNSKNRSFVPAVFSLANVLYPKSGGTRGLFGDPNQGTVELEYSPSKTFAARIEYSGGKLFGGHFDVVGANVELALSQKLAIFGRYGHGSYGSTAFGNISPNYWMAGISWRDLFIPGAIAGIAGGQPFIESAVGNGTQTNIEAFYNYPVNDNIRVTPLIQVISNSANQSSNGMIITGSIRTIFSF